MTAHPPRASLEPDPGDGDLRGTFSIVAIDPQTGEAGAAVASRFPAVGKVVPYVRAGVGAFCTQSSQFPAWGPRALDLMASGASPAETLYTLLKDDTHADERQLAAVDMKGRVANYTGKDADLWHGAQGGRYYSCQGNTLVGIQVIQDMAKAFESTEGTLADRLMAALVAGDRAGGDRRGRLGAGIIVVGTAAPNKCVALYVDEDTDAVNTLYQKYLAEKPPSSPAPPK